MKKFAIALLLASLVSVPAQAGKQDFTLVNSTGYVISEVYVSPSRSEDWEEDVMGQDVLGTGETVDIQFDRRDDACRYDLMVVYDDGESAEWSGFDLCKVSRIKIYYKRQDGSTWAESE